MNDLLTHILDPAWKLEYDPADRCYVLSTDGYAIWCDPSVARSHPYVIERILANPVEVGVAREWTRNGCVLAIDMPVPFENPSVVVETFM